MVKCLLISATAILISGCATAPHVPLNLPNRPVFTEYTDALWQSLPLEAVENITADDLACKQYIREAEARIRIHNGE
jgi:hypothetical protein